MGKKSSEIAVLESGAEIALSKEHLREVSSQIVQAGQDPQRLFSSKLMEIGVMRLMKFIYPEEFQSMQKELEALASIAHGDSERMQDLAVDQIYKVVRDGTGQAYGKIAMAELILGNPVPPITRVRVAVQEQVERVKNLGGGKAAIHDIADIIRQLNRLHKIVNGSHKRVSAVLHAYEDDADTVEIPFQGTNSVIVSSLNEDQRDAMVNGIATECMIDCVAHIDDLGLDSSGLVKIAAIPVTFFDAT